MKRNVEADFKFNLNECFHEKDSLEIGKNDEIEWLNRIFFDLIGYCCDKESSENVLYNEYYYISNASNLKEEEGFLMKKREKT